MKIFSQEKVNQISRILLLGFLFLIIYDGALRKWFFVSHEKIIFVIKDALIFICFLLIFFSKNRQKFFDLSNLVIISIACYSLYVFLELANPLLPNLWVGMWGVKSHLLYAVLILIIPVIISDTNTLFYWLKKIYPWIVAPVCLIAIAQCFSAPDSFLNNLVRGGSYYVSPLGGGLVRSTGTFSYISGFTWFLQAAMLIGFHLIIIEKKFNFKLVVPLALLFFAIPTNGSRSAIMVVIISYLIMVISYVNANILNIKTALKYVMCLLGLAMVSFLLFFEAWGGLLIRFFTSYTTPGDTARYYSAFTNAFNFFEISGWFGYGVGSASNVAPFLVNGVEPYVWLPPHIGKIGFEEESGRLVVELGILGWCISMLMRILICIFALNLILRGKNAAIKGAAIFSFPTVLLGLYIGSGVFAPPIGSAFYWFCVAVILIAWNENKNLKDNQWA